MSRIKKIEDEIKDLSPEERSALRAWFLEYDAELWDRQFEIDVQTGKLETLRLCALEEESSGRSMDL